MINNANKIWTSLSCVAALTGLFFGTSLPALATDAVVLKEHGGSFVPKYPQPNYGTGEQRKLIEKGEYLVKAGDCLACHTIDSNKPFAGGLPIKTPFGTFYSPNITPDVTTGIGKWTDANFIKAMHEGVAPDGSNYFPVFPYTSFTKIHKQDLEAIKAYLFSIPAIHEPNKKPDAMWPFSWRLTQSIWKLLFFKEGYFQYDPELPDDWNRGAYLVQGLGHCGECHTPRNFMGAMKNRYYLTGAFIDGYWAPDITSLGLEASIKDIKLVFSHGILLHQAGMVAGPMAQVTHDSLSFLADKDLEAMAIYLKSIENPYSRTAGVSGKHSNLKLGKQVYDNSCAICHDDGQASAPRLLNKANWTFRLQHGGLPALYEHALKGLSNMPPRGGCVRCTDQEVLAAVDYILEKSGSVDDLKRRVAAMKSPKVEVPVIDGKKIYQETCSVCHDKGKLNAPTLGDEAVWNKLIKKNMDVLIINTVTGIGNMPPKGGCDTCSNAQIKAAVKYMVQQSIPNGDYNLW